MILKIILGLQGFLMVMVLVLLLLLVVELETWIRLNEVSVHIMVTIVRILVTTHCLVLSWMMAEVPVCFA